MARSIFLDPMMDHNFAMIEVPVLGALPLAFPIKTAQSAIANGNFVGFQGMTIPTISMEMKTIKEGNNQFVHQVPMGHQTGGNVTLTMAVFQFNLDMFGWWQQVVSGIFAPRRNLLLCHTSADKALPARMLLCSNCIPTSWKPASDFNANSSTVSIETLTFYTENITPIPVPPANLLPK